MPTSPDRFVPDPSVPAASGSGAVPAATDRIPLPVGEAGFRVLAAALPQMLWVSAPSGGVHYISPKWVEFTGSDEASLLGDGFRVYVHPDDRANLAARRADPNKGAAAGSDRPVEFRLLRHDGVYRLIEAHVAHLRDDHGEIAWVVGSAFDVTDEREAETQARERREQLSVALAATGLARFAFYPREQRIVGDDRFNQILGTNLEDLVRDHGLAGVLAMIHPDDVSMVDRSLTEAFAGGPDYDVEYRFRRQLAGGDTEERWLAARGRAEFDADGKAVRILGVVEDISERRHEDEARLQAQKREAIGTLASGVAHDFNNVLSAILSNASLAEAESAAGDSPSESLAEITRAARRAADMVRRLLVVSREEEPASVAFDPGDVVREACALIQPTLPGTVELSCEIGSPLPTVIGDATQLHQITLNLVTNASHAVGEHGAIKLTVRSVTLDASAHPGLQAGRYVAIDVADTGVGMPEKVLDRVFDPYFTTRAAGGGSGLGLTASRRIAHNHGGEIEIRSEVGVGTAVRVYLPAAAVAVAGSDTEPAPQQADVEAIPSAPLTDPPSTSTMVMFVDDELALVRLARRALPMSGFRTETFDRPLEAVAALAADPSAFDVLVTDLSMPGLSGIELIAAVRTIRADLPVVLSSGYLTPEHRARAEELGVDAFVSKPCSIRDLSAAINRVIAARR